MPAKEPEKKIELLRGLMSRGEWRQALKLAASWPRLGLQRDAIQRGWAAYSNPDFYRQMKMDPDALIAKGIEALKVRYAKETE